MESVIGLVMCVLALIAWFEQRLKAKRQRIAQCPDRAWHHEIKPIRCVGYPVRICKKCGWQEHVYD